MPVAPFISTVHGTTNASRCVLIAFVHNRHGELPGELHTEQARDASGLYWGLLAIECAMAGDHQPHLPQAKYLAAPMQGSHGMEQAISGLMHKGETPSEVLAP